MLEETKKSNEPVIIIENKKVDQIIKLLEEIKDNARPKPFYLSVFTWIFQHLPFLLLIMFIAYIAFEIWGIIELIRLKIDNINNKFDGMKESILGIKDVIADSIINLVDKVKIW